MATTEPVPTYVSSQTAKGIGGANIEEHLELWQAQKRDSQRLEALYDRFLGTEEALRNVVTQSGENASAAQSMVITEDEIPLRRDDDIESSTSTTLLTSRFFLRGDLVVFPYSFGPILTIFVKTMKLGSLFYTEKGSWMHTQPKYSDFAVPDFLDPSTMDEILPFAPNDTSVNHLADKDQAINLQAPRDLGKTALAKMQHFRSASEDLFRQHADRLNRAYDILAPTTFSEGAKALTLQKIALILFEKESISTLSSAMLWTAHITLVRLQNVIHKPSSHRQYPNFSLMPKEGLEAMYLVRKWMREYQECQNGSSAMLKDASIPKSDKLSGNPIATFVDKARIKIMESRCHRSISPSGCIGPVIDKQADLELSSSCKQDFSGHERLILQHIDAWVQNKSLKQSPLHASLVSVGPMLLRAIGLYKHLDLTQQTGFTLLQELGIVPAWQNPLIQDLKYGIPGLSPLHPAWKLRRQAEEQSKAFEMHDTMAEYRKDWGDLPVYCIDKTHTVDVDDGISVEDVEGKPQEAWLHVHIANPSAFIPPTSSIAQWAGQMSQSIYLPERRVSMLDSRLSSSHFSLKNDCATITFSTKVNEAGDILATSISHGILHNVIRLSTRKVDEALLACSADHPNCLPMLVVGTASGQSPESLESGSPTAPPLTEKYIESLKRIQKFAGSLWKQQRSLQDFQGGKGLEDVPPNVKVSFDGKAGVPLPGHGLSHEHFQKDPTISLTSSSNPALSSAARLVGQMMVLAGRVAASWCKDRRITIPYRGFRNNPEPALSPSLFRKNFLEPLSEAAATRGGPIEFDRAFFEALISVGHFDWSSTPLEHPLLNISAYATITSPIRRFSDLLAHWQIEATIRHERKVGRMLKENDDRSFLPFTQRKVDTACKLISARTRDIRRLTQSSQLHWIYLALSRAFYFKEAPLPALFEIRIRQPDVVDSREEPAMLIGWGLAVSLATVPEVTKAHNGYQPGDVWEARIEKVSVYHRNMEMRPTRLLSRKGS